MNIKTMLITALAALRIESKMAEPPKEHELIRRVLSEARLPEYADEQDERGALIEIKELITAIIDGHTEYNESQILRRLKLATTQVKPLYDSVMKFLEDDELPKEESEVEGYYSRIVTSYYFQLRQGLQGGQLLQNAGKLIGALKGTEQRVSLESAIVELQKSLQTFGTRSHNKIPSLVDSITTNETEKFKVYFNNIGKKAAGQGLVTGWKDINQMLGCNGGITEELWLMPALPFNCKSLFSLLMALSIPIFNSPDKVMQNIKGDLQPIILDLSLENELDVNIGYAYQAIYRHFEGEAPSLAFTDEMTAEERAQKTAIMTDYLCSKIRMNGWEYNFQRHTNTDFKVQYLDDLISQQRAKGFHVAGIRADYLGTINKAGHGNGIAGSDIKEIYRMARNIQVVKNRGFILAPHQISPEGKKLRAIDQQSFTKNLPGRGLYDSCSSLDNEADGEMFFNKRVIEGKSYLEVQRGKHRVIIDTPEKHHYSVIPFHPVGILPWDYDRDYKVTAPSINHFTGGLGGDDIF